MSMPIWKIFEVYQCVTYFIPEIIEMSQNDWSNINASQSSFEHSCGVSLVLMVYFHLAEVV